MTQLNVEALDKVRDRLRDDALVAAFVRVLTAFHTNNRPLRRDDLTKIGCEVGVCEEKLLAAGLITRDGGYFWPVRPLDYVDETAEETISTTAH